MSSVRSAYVSNPGTAHLRSSGLLAPWHRMATVGCSMPASVYSRVARKRKFSTLSLRSATESGSFFRKRPCAMCKDNTVGNVVAETGRDCGTTARLQRSFNVVSAMCLAIERRGSTLTVNRLQGHRRQWQWKAGNLYAAYSRTVLDCKKTTVFCFLPSWSTLLVLEVWEGCWGKIWRGSPQWNSKAQLPKPQTETVATAQRPKNRSAYQHKGQRVLSQYRKKASN